MNAYPDLRRADSAISATGGPVWLLIALAGAVGVFWYGLVSLGVAWSTPEYSHGPVIPLLSAYMFLVEMRRVPRAGERDGRIGVWVVAAALLLGLLGNIVHIPDIVTYAMILWIWGLVLTIFGWREGRLLWPPVLHLLFMLPLPQFVYWQLSISLQQISSEIGVALISWAGVPVFLDGNVIDLGLYKLQVAEACSGLRYLFPILSFSYVFGVLYTGPLWHKLVLLLAAAPITILMNAFRIGVIGLLVDRFGIDQAEGFLHNFQGWVIFLACIGLLFLLAVLMQRTTARPKPIVDTLQLDVGAALPQFRRIAGLRPTRGLITVALASLTLAVLVHATPERPRVVPDRLPLALFPTELGDWQGTLAGRLPPEIERTLGADDYFAATYRDGASPTVSLFIAYYDRQTSGSGIHSPEVCLPSGGWEVSAWRTTALSVPIGDRSEIVPANRAIIQKGLSQQLVLYWFEDRGRRFTNDYVAKAATVWDSLLRGRTDGALVRLITPLRPGENPRSAEDRLVRFMSKSLAILPRYVPK